MINLRFWKKKMSTQLYFLHAEGVREKNILDSLIYNVYIENLIRIHTPM